MASHIKKGESLLIPFRNGQSISDSQLKPRMYKTKQAFEKSFPGHYLGKDGVELVEYAEVVRCKDCFFWHDFETHMDCRNPFGIDLPKPNDFCSYGVKKGDGNA